MYLQSDDRFLVCVIEAYSEHDTLQAELLLAAIEEKVFLRQLGQRARQLTRFLPSLFTKLGYEYIQEYSRGMGGSIIT